MAVCGEVAADPVAVPLLLGLGVHELSVTPRAVAAVKGEVRRWSLNDAKVLAEMALHVDTAPAVRTLVAGTIEAILGSPPEPSSITPPQPDEIPGDQGSPPRGSPPP